MSRKLASAAIAVMWLLAIAAAFGMAPNATYDPSQFFLVVPGFVGLAIAWIVTSAAALVRARQRRFADHRVWMMRSYSLTFAAVTVRLIALPFLVVTQDPVVAITLTFWSWVLNLLVAEWFVRRAANLRGPHTQAEAALSRS